MRSLFVLAVGLLLLVNFDLLAQPCGITTNPSPATICAGINVTLTASGGSTYTWAPNTNLSATTGTSVGATPNSTTTYTVSGTGCSNATVVVTVQSTPNASFTFSPNTSPCATTPIQFTNTTAGNGWTYVWDFGDGTTASTTNPLHTFNTAIGNATQNFTVTLTATAANGCTDVATQTVTLDQIPSTTMGGTGFTTYNGLNYFVKCGTLTNFLFNFTNTSTTTATNSTYTIAWGDATPNFTSSSWVTTSHTYNTGQYTLTYTVTGQNGCSITSTYYVFLGSNPAVGIGNPGNTDICAPNTLSFPITGTTNNTPGTTYTVTFNDGSAPLSFTHPPPATVAHTFTQTSCGTTSSNGSQTFVNSYSASIVASNPCGTSAGAIVPIYVSEAPTPAFTISPNPACVNSTVTFTNTSDNGGDATNGQCNGSVPSLWSITPSTGWTLASGSFGNNFGFPDDYTLWQSGSTSIGVQFTTPGTYTIKLIIANRCGEDSISNTVCIVPPPTASFTLGPVGCAPTTINATNTSTGTGCSALSYFWNVSPSTGWSFAGASTDASTNASFSFSTAGTYTITLQVTNVCGVFPVSQTITIKTPPTVLVSSVPNQCAGASISISPSATYTNGGGTISAYNWTLTGGTPASSTSQNPGNISYSAAGNYTITSSATNECGTVNNSTSFSIYPIPTANAGSDATICQGASTTLSASGSGGTAPYSYSWSPTFANTSTLSVSPSSTTTYTLSISDANSCTATDQVVVIVNPSPTLIVTGTPNVCLGGSVTMTASGTGITGYTWSPNTNLSATSGTSVIASPTVTVTYTVVGTSGAGCGGTGTYTVVIYPIPIVSINPPTSSICIGNSSALTASGASTYTWSPAATLTSNTGSTVTATPTVNTTYTVTGTSVNGCTATATSTLTVTSLPNIIASATTSTICNGQSTTLNANGGNTYTWTPSTGLSATTGNNITANPTSTTTYTVTGSLGANCNSTATVVVIVNALPTLSANAGNTNICQGESTTLTASGGSTYTWTPSTGLTPTTGANVTANPTVTTTYTITGTGANGCTTTTTIVITVNPKPILSISPLNPNICLGETLTITASGASTYTWSPAAGLNQTTGASVNASPTITTTYELIGTTSFGCKDSIPFMLQVFALPVVTALAIAYTVCNGQSATLNAVGAANFTWTPSTGLNVTTGSSVTATPSASTTYTVVGTAGQGCSSQDTVVVNILPLPNVTVNNPTSDVCVGDTANVVLTASNVTSYSWSPSTYLNVSTGATVLAHPPTTTTYTVVVTGTNGCTTTVNPVVAVHPYPTITFSQDPVTICLNSSTNVTAFGASTYDWSPSTGINPTTGPTVTLNPTANTTYSIVGTSQYGCADTTTLDVTVNTNVIGSADDYDLCFGESTNLTAVYASTYNWSPSGGLSSTNGANVIASPSTTTTYTVTGFTSSGCSTTDTVLIVVHPLPIVTVTPPNVLQCSGTDIDYTASGANTYAWSPSAGLIVTTGANITANPTQFTTYTVVGTDLNGCTASATSMVQVYPLPPINAGLDQTWCHTPINVTLAGFTPQGGIWTGPGIVDSINAVFSPWIAGIDTHTVYYHVINANGCENNDSINIIVTPVNFPTAANGDTVCYLDTPFYLTGFSPAGGVWSGFGITNGNSGLFNPSLSGPGLHPVLYSIGQGQCTRSDTTYVLVKPPPTLSVAPIPTELCIGSSIGLTASGANSYTWNPSPTLSNINNATATASPTITSTYTVSGVDANGCSNSVSIQVIVHQLPIVDAGTPQTLCSFDPPSYIFNFSPFGGMWTGTGITNAFTGEFSPQVSGPGTFNITYTATDIYGCSNIDSVFVTVIDPTAADAGNDISVCVNIPSFNLTGFSPTGGTWTGNGIVNPSAGTFNPSLAGVGTHKLIYSPAASQCIYKDSIMVTVLAAPVVTVVIADNTLCAGQSTNITAAGGTSYIWTPNIGISTTTGPDVTVTPTVTTTYTVTATDANTCTNSATATIIMNPSPILNINPAAPVICNGQSANLTASGASTYTWSPNTAINQTTGSTVTINPTVTSTYTLSGTDVNGCVDTAHVTVTVNPLPNVTLSEDDPWICSDASTQLYASGASTYTWSPFSSLSASTGATVTTNPTITTTYTITGTDANGCQDLDTISVTVFPPPITFNTQPQICRWDSVSITAYNCVSYVWSPSIGLEETSGATVLAYPLTTTTYTVIGTDIHGCTGSNTVIVTVHFPVINVAAYDDTLCDGENSVIATNGAVSYAWTPNSGLSSTNASTITANPSISTTYTLIGTDVYQCPDTLYFPITVYPQPIAAFIYDKPDGCDSLAVQFTNLTNDAFIYNWTFGYGPNDTSTNPLHWFSGPGSYDVEMYAEGLGGCRDSLFIADAITVYPEPVADFIWQQSTIPVMNGEIVYTNLSNNSDAYHWDFGDSTFSDAVDPTHTYENYGTYWTTLVAINDDGCIDSIAKAIDVKFFGGLYLPNAMTPNYGDPATRVFTPKGFNLKTYHIWIYDTWGNMLWESIELTDDGQPKESWDGYYKGELLQQDVYVWKVSATFIDDTVWKGQRYPSGEIKPTGTVTILR